MKDSTRRRVLFLFLLAGFSILNYPFVSQWVNKRSESSVIREYENSTKELGNKEKQEIRRQAEAYNEALVKKGQGVRDAFGTGEEEYGDYKQLLNPRGDGVMGYIEIPKIKVHLPIRHGTSVRVLEKSAGHLYGSSLPVGGESTHAVISSHRGLPSRELFTNLDQLEAGDCFFLTVLDEKLAYEIDEIKTVLPEDTEGLAVMPGKDYVTLVTCTPYGVNSHRLLVRGSRIDWVEEADKQAREMTADAGITRILKWIFIVSCIMIIAAGKVLLFPVENKEKRKPYENSKV